MIRLEKRPTPSRFWGAATPVVGVLLTMIAGGMESMSNAPYLMLNARDGFRMGHQQVLDSMIHDGLWDVYNDFHMGMTGELVAEKYNIAREEQDEYAMTSHHRAAAAAARKRPHEVAVALLLVGHREHRVVHAALDERRCADGSGAAHRARSFGRRHADGQSGRDGGGAVVSA